MSGYTKEDFDTKYSINLRMPDENGNMVRSPIKLHYHRAVMQEIVQAPWPALVEELCITKDDRVVVVGAGYGWGVEKLIALTGCSAVGTDTSTYIQDTKDDTEEAEICMCINQAGYDPNYSYGGEAMAYTKAAVSDKSLCLILDEDLSTQESRATIRAELGGDPTLIITEDMLSDLSDLDVSILCQDLDQLHCDVCHFSREGTRTSEELHTLTGHIVVTVGTMKRVD